MKATNAQKAEAKALQANVFRAFDEVDEMSQRYSEDIEATTEIAKTTATNLFQLAWMGTTALLGIGIYKGKVSLVKPLKWVRNGVLSKESSIGKSIDKLYESLFKQDKNTRQEFQKAFLRGKKGLEKFFGDAKYPEIKTALSELGNEFGKITADGVIKLTQTNSKKTANQVYMEILNEHTKQTPIAKWGRNLFVEGCKLKALTKSKSMGMEIPKELQKEFGLNFNYKNYKTLINTGIVGGIPILVPLFAVPYMFNAWLTDIQKKAGKIGVMKAMNNLDDPKIFANTNS